MNESTTTGELPVVYLTEKQTSELTHISQSTLRRWRYLGDGPKFYKVGGDRGNAGRRVVYRFDEVVAWIEGTSRD